MGKIINELGETDSLLDSLKLSSKAYYRVLAKTLSNLGMFGITYNSLLSSIEDVKNKGNTTKTSGDTTVSNIKTKYLTAKVERGSYDPANGMLTVSGKQVLIIKQQNQKGPQHESKQAKLMRLLFNDVKSNFGTTAMRTVVSVIPADFAPKHRKLVKSYISEINKKIYQETGIKEFLLSNQHSVMINELYL
jgi:hypothetical protein